MQSSKHIFKPDSKLLDPHFEGYKLTNYALVDIVEREEEERITVTTILPDTQQQQEQEQVTKRKIPLNAFTLPSKPSQKYSLPGNQSKNKRVLEKRLRFNQLFADAQSSDVYYTDLDQKLWVYHTNNNNIILDHVVLATKKEAPSNSNGPGAMEIEGANQQLFACVLDIQKEITARMNEPERNQEELISEATVFFVNDGSSSSSQPIVVVCDGYGNMQLFGKSTNDKGTITMTPLLPDAKPFALYYRYNNTSESDGVHFSNYSSVQQQQQQQQLAPVNAQEKKCYFTVVDAAFVSDSGDLCVLLEHSLMHKTSGDAKSPRSTIFYLTLVHFKSVQQQQSQSQSQYLYSFAAVETLRCDAGTAPIFSKLLAVMTPTPPTTNENNNETPTAASSNKKHFLFMMYEQELKDMAGPSAFDIQQQSSLYSLDSRDDEYSDEEMYYASTYEIVLHNTTTTTTAEVGSTPLPPRHSIQLNETKNSPASLLGMEFMAENTTRDQIGFKYDVDMAIFSLRSEHLQLSTTDDAAPHLIAKHIHTQNAFAFVSSGKRQKKFTTFVTIPKPPPALPDQYSSYAFICDHNRLAYVYESAQDKLHKSQFQVIDIGATEDILGIRVLPHPQRPHKPQIILLSNNSIHHYCLK